MTRMTTRAHSRSDRSVSPRRWWRALDQLTLETMNPPIPAHVRAAMSDLTGTVRPDATSETGPARNNFRGDLMSNTDTTTFAATVRASAPGRDEKAAETDVRSNAEFAQAIRAAAPGRRNDR